MNILKTYKYTLISISIFLIFVGIISAISNFNQEPISLVISSSTTNIIENNRKITAGHFEHISNLVTKVEVKPLVVSNVHLKIVNSPALMEYFVQESKNKDTIVKNAISANHQKLTPKIETNEPKKSIFRILSTTEREKSIKEQEIWWKEQEKIKTKSLTRGPLASRGGVIPNGEGVNEVYGNINGRGNVISNIFFQGDGFGITNLNINIPTNYATTNWVISQGYLTNETDPVWNSVSSLYASKLWVIGQGYLTTETDPIWSSVSNQYAKTSYVADTYYPLSNPSNYVNSNIITGLASTQWVINQGYLTNVSWIGGSSNSIFVSNGIINITFNTNYLSSVNTNQSAYFNTTTYTPQSSAPINPSVGTIYYNTVDSRLKVFTATGWRNLNN